MATTTEGTNPLFNMRLAPEYLTWLDDLRRQEPDIPTRSEMARRCIERAATAAGLVPKRRARKSE